MTKKRIKWTTKKFVNKVFELEGDQYTPLEGYTNMRTKILMRHEKCGTVYTPRPDGFLFEGKRCPTCGHKLVGTNPNKHTNAWWVKTVSKLGKGEYTALEPYKNFNTPVLVKHNCGYTYLVSPTKFINYKQRCDSCARAKRLSKGEKLIKQYFASKGIDIKISYAFPELKDKRVLHYDCYVPSYNLLIEYQGKQHYEPRRFGSEVTEKRALDKFKRQQRHDKLKKDYAINNNYNFLEIPYTSNTQEKVTKLIDNYLKNIRKVK